MIPTIPTTIPTLRLLASVAAAILGRQAGRAPGLVKYEWHSNTVSADGAEYLRRQRYKYRSISQYSREQFALKNPDCYMCPTERHCH